MENLNKPGVNVESFADSAKSYYDLLIQQGSSPEEAKNKMIEMVKGLGRAVKLATDFSFIASGEGTKLRDNPGALIEKKKMSDREAKQEEGAGVESKVEEIKNKPEVVEIKEGPAEVKERPAEIKKDEQRKSDWEIRDEKGEARYEDGKLIYEDRESGKVWENGKEVAGGEKTDEVKAPEIGWRAWGDDGHLRYRYEDKKMVYTDASGRTWVNGEERKRAGTESVSEGSRTPGLEEEERKVSGVASGGNEAKVIEEDVPKAVEEASGGGIETAMAEPRVETVTAETEAEPRVEVEAPKVREESAGVQMYKRNMQKLEEAKNAEDIDEKIRLLEELVGEGGAPKLGRIWGEANEMLEQIRAEREGNEPTGVNEEGAIGQEDAPSEQEENEDEQRALASLDSDESDLTGVIEVPNRGGGGAMEREQTVGEKVRSWVRRHPRVAAAIAAGAAIAATAGIAFAVHGQMKGNRIVNTKGPVGIEQVDSNRGSRAGSNAVSGNNLRNNTKNNANVTGVNNKLGNTAAGGGAATGNTVNAAAAGTGTQNNVAPGGGNVAQNKANNAPATSANTAPAAPANNVVPNGGSGGAVSENGSGNDGNTAGEQAKSDSGKAGSGEQANNGGVPSGETENKWKPSADMIPTDGGKYMRFNRANTKERISGTNNWKVGEVEIYDSEGNLTGLVSIVTPNGLDGIENINFNNIDAVTGVYPTDGGQMMFVNYAEAVPSGEDLIIGEVRILDESGNATRKVPIVAEGGDRGITRIDFNNEVNSKWQPSADMYPTDEGNYWRFNRWSTPEKISGTDNVKVGEVEIYDSEGNLTGLVSIVSPNGVEGIESMNFSNIDEVTGMYPTDGGQMMFVDYANSVQAGENEIVGEVRILDENGNVVQKAPKVALGGDRGITMIDFNNVVSEDGGFNLPGMDSSVLASDNSAREFAGAGNVENTSDSGLDTNVSNPPEGVPREARQDSSGRWIADMWYGQTNSYSVQVGGETRQIAATGETQVYDSEGNYLGKTFYLVDGSNLWVPHEELATNPVMRAAEEAGAEVGDMGVNAEEASVEVGDMEGSEAEAESGDEEDANAEAEDIDAESELAQESEGVADESEDEIGAETGEGESADAEMFGGEGIGGE